MSLGEWLRHFFNLPAPSPSFRNVIPAGAGWYRYSQGYWRRIPQGDPQGLWGEFSPASADGWTRYLSDGELFGFAISAFLALFIKKRGWL